MTSDKSATTEQRLNNLMTGDTWHTHTLNGSWSGSLKYRYSFSLREVHLKFTGSNPGGTVGDGSKFVIATLPSGYRPNSGTDLPLSCDKTGSSGQAPHVFVDVDGTLNVYGISSSATYVSLSAIMPIFDD